MQVKVLIVGLVTNLVSAYSSQTGCCKSEKEAFWDEFEDVLHAIPTEFQRSRKSVTRSVLESTDVFTAVLVMANKMQRDSVYSGSALCLNLTIANAFFQKKPQYLITYLP
ncbi:hypothetical protein PYW07_013929 [Mythimna separata]|uniref:Uncharacterized protein n=1 Tax=Mythimna separata TaxID=271217 RepID=A0AAD7YG27_MYTSE|nr:hypothetical protein PYW07_013929 [Mythimna separata]